MTKASAGEGGASSSFSSGPKFAERPVLLGHIVQVPALRGQAGYRQAAGVGQVARRQHQGAVGNAQLFQDVMRRAGLGMRMGEQPRRDHAEAFPYQFPAQLGALGQSVADPGQGHQRPFPVPVLRRAFVDALRGVRRVALPQLRDQVQAAAAMPFRLQPVLRDQAEDAGAQQPFIDAQWRQQLDQVQPDGAAVRRQRIAQQADAERFCRGGSLLIKRDRKRSRGD